MGPSGSRAGGPELESHSWQTRLHSPPAFQNRRVHGANRERAPILAGPRYGSPRHMSEPISSAARNVALDDSGRYCAIAPRMLGIARGRRPSKGSRPPPDGPRWLRKELHHGGVSWGGLSRALRRPGLCTASSWSGAGGAPWARCSPLARGDDRKARSLRSRTGRRRGIEVALPAP